MEEKMAWDDDLTDEQRYAASYTGAHGYSLDQARVKH
jgi:hypothetical protein